ncbi:ROK family protein [Vallitalea pronyensis]|uniref:ROK family protein n=1 Tax=Vallitalea pronyensis TaxID=1348613 RepID=A0A8J8MPM7_9FIRM|nr:ROK family protein [Vallitalea pronyensis]QUI25058.1 ROK family protein [Vallitalea pronyensis]
MYNIGIDLGGTNIAAAIVAEDGTIIRKGSTPTMNERQQEAIIKDMAMLAIKLVEDEAGISMDDIHSIGVGSPGTPDPVNGMIVYANNLNFHNTPIRDEMQKYINKPIFVGNDANVAALGEYECGSGSSYNDLVAITLGTGVGSGVIINGTIIDGSFYGGAELGHVSINFNGIVCTCGRKGCWEQYSSASALIRDAKEAAKNNPESKLNELVHGDLTKMNAKIPFDAAQAGDKTAQEVISQYIKHLAVGLVNVINIFQPEVIVLGGGVSAQGDNLIQPLHKEIINEIYGGEKAFKTKIQVAELGNDAGIIGAAMLYKAYEK